MFHVAIIHPTTIDKEGLATNISHQTLLSPVLDAPLPIPHSAAYPQDRWEKKTKKEFNLSEYLSPFLRVDLK